MMRYLTLGEVIELHRRLLQATGGASGIRDFGALASAIAQPKATFGDVDLYPTLVEKAAALCFSLVQGHPFVDGNKRVGHAVAAGRIGRAHLTDWLRQHLKPLR
ncbi:MAG: Fic family protein [Candidatus Rokubacteria bacterium]|nr:Fic family protein [Candidatus Rokubacteria bacterium]